MSLSFLSSNQLLSLFLEKKSLKSFSTESLDGLRGLAAIAILIQHLKGNDLLPLAIEFEGDNLGRVGVCLFFVLSSFLLTTKFIIKPDINLKNSGLWIKYAQKRILRISPLYIFVLAVYCIFPGFKYSIANFGKHLILIEGLGHFWTIPVEMFFYLTLPLVVYIINRLAKQNLLQVILYLSGILGIVYALGLGTIPPSGFSTPSLFPYLSVFLMGSLASLVHVKLLALPENLKNRFHYLFEIAAFILILVAIPVIFYFHKLPKEAINLIYGLMGSSFLIFHLHGQGTLKKILGSPLLCFFGTISFGIYLWHNAILGYVDARLHAPDPLKILVIFGLTLLIASASYLAIERPFIKLKFNLNFANKDAKQVHR